MRQLAFSLSERSKARMQGVHPDIVAVMELAIQRTPIDFTVLEGKRTIERQRELVAKGASKTMNSRHLTGHALDVAPLSGGQVSWDWPLYHKLAPVIKGAADDLGVDLEWGGDWTSFKDGPHWQLSWHQYDKEDMTCRATLNAELSEPMLPRDPAPIAPPAVEVPEKPARESVWQSTTIRAQIMQWITANGNAAYAAWNAQDDTTKLIFGGLAIAGTLAGAWVFKERIRKWVDGDR